MNNRYHIITNSNERRILVIQDMLDVDNTPEISEFDFDAMYIDIVDHSVYTTDNFRKFLWDISPIISQKCAFKPLFINSSVQGKVKVQECIADGYTSDPLEDKVEKKIEKILGTIDKWGLKRIVDDLNAPYALYARIGRYMVSRDNFKLKFTLRQGSPTGYASVYEDIFTYWKRMDPMKHILFFQKLLNQGFIRSSKFIEKVHLCPNCFNSHLLFTECCPSCQTSNIQEETVLHHFRCANVSPESTYVFDGQLRCPKCKRFLRHIGVDYDRPANVYLCQECHHNFITPKMKALCTKCNKKLKPEELISHDIREFEMTKSGIEVFASGEILYYLTNEALVGYTELESFKNSLRLFVYTPQKEEYSEGLIAIKLWAFEHNTKTLIHQIGTRLLQYIFRDLHYWKIAATDNFIYLMRIIPEDKIQKEMEDIEKQINKLQKEILSDMKNTYDLHREICVFKKGGDIDSFMNRLNIIPENN